jgi:Anti-sigma-K factor rskA
MMSYSHSDPPISEAQMMLAAGYVLGDLSSDEMLEFEQSLAENPALVLEVNALQVSLGLIPVALQPAAAPMTLKHRILAANAAEDAATVTTAVTTAATTANRIGAFRTPEESVSATGDRASTFTPKAAGFPWGRLLAGLSLLAALLLGADNWRLRQAIAQQNESDQRSVAEIMQRPNSKLVALKGENNDAAGTLIFTPGKWEQVVVSLGDLPALPPDLIYRMWLKLDDGSVLPCGEFRTNDTGAVFITLRPEKTPSKGKKASGIFVTLDPVNAPMEPKGEKIMSGTI